MFSFDEIKQLAELVGKYKLNTVELKSANGDSIIIKGQNSNSQQEQIQEKITKTTETPVNSANINIEEPEKTSKTSEIKTGNIIKSPLVGTFYAAADPNSKPFVAVGDKIKKGDIVCIIESMKMMNEVPSEFDGTVREIKAQNGDAVEYDQPLIILD